MVGEGSAWAPSTAATLQQTWGLRGNSSRCTSTLHNAWPGEPPRRRRAGAQEATGMGALASLQVATKLFSPGKCIWWLEKWAELKNHWLAVNLIVLVCYLSSHVRPEKNPMCPKQKSTWAQEFQLTTTTTKNPFLLHPIFRTISMTYMGLPQVKV